MWLVHICFSDYLIGSYMFLRLFDWSVSVCMFGIFSVLALGNKIEMITMRATHWIVLFISSNENLSCPHRILISLVSTIILKICLSRSKQNNLIYTNSTYVLVRVRINGSQLRILRSNLSILEKNAKQITQKKGKVRSWKSNIYFFWLFYEKHSLNIPQKNALRKRVSPFSLQESIYFRRSIIDLFKLCVI